jgi:radical SAM superfamily enzyme YgiQ (UPF0313 family)
MTSLAIQLLYQLFNARPDVACERVFYVPGETPRSLESGQVLTKFDVVAFSLQFETDYVHALEMLCHSRIPLHAQQRQRPWVIAGGPCVVSNPFPMLPFVNVFQLGDIEPVLDQLFNALINAKDSSDFDSQLDRHFLLPGRSEAQRAMVSDLDGTFHPTCQILPVQPYPNELEPTFGQSLLVEISRGCDRRCDFCLTTYQCSPRRERSLARIEEIIQEGLQCTKVNKVALLASGFIDHSQLPPLLASIINRGNQLSVPSLRADMPDPDILRLIHQGGQRTLTFAPEAGSERLRRTIGKAIPNEVFHSTLQTSLAAGFSQFKLYFMIGLPSETADDVLAIETLCHSLLELPPRRHRLHVTIAPFIPKPHTPYQWVGLPSLTTLKERVELLKGLRRLARVQVDWPNLRWAVIQGALSRGTTEFAPVIAQVAQTPNATAGTWFRVAKNQGFNLESVATADYPPAVQFPWDRIDVGINRNILLQRFARLDS